MHSSPFFSQFSVEFYECLLNHPFCVSRTSGDRKSSVEKESSSVVPPCSSCLIVVCPNEETAIKERCSAAMFRPPTLVAPDGRPNNKDIGPSHQFAVFSSQARPRCIVGTMTLSSTVVQLLLLTRLFSPSVSFSHVQTPGRQRFCHKLSAESKSSPSERKPLTSAEILAKARKASGVPEDEPPPKIFEDDLLTDMQQILLSLEKRVKEGPGSVSLPELRNLEIISNRVLVEMTEKDVQRASGGNGGSTVQTKSIVSTLPFSTGAKGPEHFSEEDGPEYDGEGGLGLARGTANTYVIPGMDEMSPEEYQKALQDSISNRQKQRKLSGAYGNRATWDYLNNLTGETGQLKANPGE
jgi:hypothetical protein